MLKHKILHRKRNCRTHKISIYNWGTYSDDYDGGGGGGGGGVSGNMNFYDYRRWKCWQCCHKSQPSKPRTIESAYQEELTLLQVVPWVLQLHIWFSECLYSVVHHLYVKIWVPLLAKDKVSIKGINSCEALLSATGLTLQFQLHCSAQTFESWHTEGLQALYISQCT